MAWKLFPRSSVKRAGRIERFDARYWTINFPRPMMASVVSSGTDEMRIDAVFYRKNDLLGLIWESEDRWSHPALTYLSSVNYKGVTLSFRWRSEGVQTITDPNGPVLTIEGHDQSGAPATWYIRLANYAAGSPTDSVVTLDFDTMKTGFSADGPPIRTQNIDRMFLSIVAPGYDTTDGPLAAVAEGSVIISEIKVTGGQVQLPVGELPVPENPFSVATGYDDSYNLTPERVLDAIGHLGFGSVVTHYVGMSHYFNLAIGGGLVTPGLNKPCAAWHHSFVKIARARGIEVILSLSYELFAEHCPDAWAQRAANGDKALTGWVPPSTILSPCNTSAMAYLQNIGKAFTQIALDEGAPVRFQVGEPWWWIEFVPPYRIFLYDAAVTAALGADSVPIATMKSTTLSASQKNMLDRAGQFLAASTAALVSAVKSLAPSARTHVLVYLPTVLDPEAPDARRANVPLGWAKPAFDVLQLEDYDWVQEGRTDETAGGVSLATQRLGYPVAEQHYFSGFVLRPEDKRTLWPRIDKAALQSVLRGTRETFIWALPQVLRDGYIHSTSFSNDGSSPIADEDLPVFSFRPNWREPMVERVSFLTDVMRTPKGVEQRRALRETPRRTFEADFLLKGSERTFWGSFMDSLGGREIMVPLYWEVESLKTDLTGLGLARINFDTTNREWPYFAGGLALLSGKTALDYEVVQIESVDANGITLLIPALRSWKRGTKLYPLKRAVIDSAGDVTHKSAAVAVTTAQFRIVVSNPWTPATGAEPVYLARPVFTEEPNWREDLAVDVQQTLATFDSKIGRTYRADVAGRTFAGQSHRWFLNGRERLAKFRDLLYRNRGRAGSFWLPTFKADFKLVAAVSSGSTQLVVENTGLQYSGGPKPGREYIAIRHEGGTIYRKITSVTPGTTRATERLNLDLSLGLALSPGQVRKISYMDTSRFDVDDFEITHHAGIDGLHECAAVFRAFAARRTAPLPISYPIPIAVEQQVPCGDPSGVVQYYNLSSVFPVLEKDVDANYPEPVSLYPAQIITGPFSVDMRISAFTELRIDDNLILNGSTEYGFYPGSTDVAIVPAGQVIVIQVRNTINQFSGASGIIKIAAASQA